MMTTDNKNQTDNNPTPNPQPLDQPEQQPQEGVAINGNGHRDPGAGDLNAGLTAEEIERKKVLSETGNDPGPDVTPSPESVLIAQEHPKVESTNDNAFKPEADYAKEVSDKQRTKLGFPKKTADTKKA